MTPFEDLPVWTMAEWMGQKAEIDRLRAKLADAKDDARQWEAAASRRLEDVRVREAAIARVRAICAGDPTLLWPGQQILDTLEDAE